MNQNQIPVLLQPLKENRQNIDIHLDFIKLLQWEISPQELWGKNGFHPDSHTDIQLKLSYTLISHGTDDKQASSDWLIFCVTIF